MKRARRQRGRHIYYASRPVRDSHAVRLKPLPSTLIDGGEEKAARHRTLTAPTDHRQTTPALYTARNGLVAN